MDHGFIHIQIMIVGFMVHDHQTCAVKQRGQHNCGVLAHAYRRIAVLTVILHKSAGNKLHTA